MKKVNYSFIVPLYNRQQELRELLQSVEQLKRPEDAIFECIVVEDGSDQPSEHIVLEFQKKGLPVQYYFKKNEGPGLTRNFGQKKAQGDWLIFLDSDVILPKEYLINLHQFLKEHPEVDFFGGPDANHPLFSPIQKAIGYAMTSPLTTGGIRGSKKSMESFKPRSFNMGVKKEAFIQVEGFSHLRFGEDMDLSLRLTRLGLHSALISSAYVFHKRRSRFHQFFKQVYNSGMARIVLWQLHPGSLKAVHILPSLFVLYTFFCLAFFWLFPWILLPLILWTLLILLHSVLQLRSVYVGVLSLIASFFQLFGYGLGFIRASWDYLILKKPIQFAFRESFYK